MKGAAPAGLSSLTTSAITCRYHSFYDDNLMLGVVNYDNLFLI
jgi:hypothetical protein